MKEVKRNNSIPCPINATKKFCTYTNAISTEIQSL